MNARWKSLGQTLGLSAFVALLMAPLGSVQAAYPSWMGGGGLANRPLFRPWERTQPPVMVSRWRPQTAAGATPKRFVSGPLPSAGYSGGRALLDPRSADAGEYSVKTKPAVRGYGLGTGFRPNDQGPVDGDLFGGAAPRLAETPPAYPAARFRPTPTARKRSYEEIQASQRTYGGRPVSTTPYPMLPTPPMAAYGHYWRSW